MRRKIEAGAGNGESLGRRAMLGLAAKGVAGSLVVSQLSLASDVNEVTGAEGEEAGSCVLTAALTEGPYFVDERLNRSDIREDPATGQISQGVPLELTFNVIRVDAGGCTPLTGAYLDVWHCDAAGVYSDVGGATGRRFLRGYQITDGSGVARFTTIYPGWYTGRAVHIHFKLRLFGGSSTTYEFTSQFFFDESLTDVVHAQGPYVSNGTRNTRNSTDRIYNGLSSTAKSALTLRTAASGGGYSGSIDLGVRI